MCFPRVVNALIPETHSGLQSVFHNQPGVQQHFQPVADSQDKSTQLSIELHRLQQIPQAGYPDRGSVFSPQAHPYANTSRFNSNTADGGSTSAYHGRSSQEIMRAASPGQESFFTEFIHDSRNLSTQTSRPASAGCDSRTTFPSTGPKGIFQSWNEQRPEYAEPRHHSSPPGPAFGVAPAALRQNTMDPVDEFLEMPTPEQNAGGEPPPADVLFTSANIPSAPLDGLSSALAREQDIIPNSSTSANPTNEDQNSGEDTMKYGLTETELDSLGYNVWNILDDVMIVWQKSSVRARAASAGNVLVKLLYRDSCPLIDAILTHGVDKGVVNRSDVSQQRPPQRPSECTWTSERVGILI